MAVGIRSFRHAGLRRYRQRGDARRLPSRYLPKITAALNALDVARSPSDLDGLHGLHPLHGPRADFWAVTISRNWRIVFRFDHNGDARDVDFEDYH